MAIRKFRLLGSLESDKSVIKITFGNHPAQFFEAIKSSSPHVLEGEVDLDDQSVQHLPTTIEVVTGVLSAGPLLWDYALDVNPRLTEEEAMYILQPREQTPRHVRAAYYERGGKYSNIKTLFSMGDNEKDSTDNRTNIKLNGYPIDLIPAHHVSLISGDILTFETKVFAIRFSRVE